MQAKRPFLYTLIPCGDNNQDYMFQRIYSASGYGPNVWAMHIDLDDDTPEQVLMFVQGVVAPSDVEERIDRSKDYFLQQLEPYLHPSPRSDHGIDPADEAVAVAGEGPHSSGELVIVGDRSQVGPSVAFNIGSIQNSIVQVAADGSVQIVEQHGLDLESARGIVEHLRSAGEQLGVGSDRQEELAQKIATVEAQLNSPAPKARVLREMFQSIRSILEGATGSALAAGLISRITELLGG